MENGPDFYLLKTDSRRLSFFGFFFRQIRVPFSSMKNI